MSEFIIHSGGRYKHIFYFRNTTATRTCTVHVPPSYNFLMHPSHQFHWSESNCNQLQQRQASHVSTPSVVGLNPQLITTGLHVQGLFCVEVGLFVGPCLRYKSFLQLLCQSSKSTNNPLFFKLYTTVSVKDNNTEYSKCLQQQLSWKDFHHSTVTYRVVGLVLLKPSLDTNGSLCSTTKQLYAIGQRVSKGAQQSVCSSLYLAKFESEADLAESRPTINR